MSLRYVWDKSTILYYPSQARYDSASAFYPNSDYQTIYYGNSYYSNFSKTDCFTVSGYDSVRIEEGSSVTIPAGSYFSVYSSYYELSYTPDELEIEWVVGNAYFDFPYPYKVTKKARAGDFISKVSAASSAQYPIRGVSGDYYYERLGSDSIDPSAVSIPSVIRGADGLFTITVTPDVNTYGGTISYRYEYSTDGGTTWTATATATATQQEITIPAGAPTIKVRVRASDDMGFTSSAYIASNTAIVTWNNAPVLSGSDGSLGTFSTSAPSFNYSVTDKDGDSVTITEKLDDVVKRTYTATLGVTNTLTWTANEWLKVLNGNHTVTITADDGKEGIATRTLTFTKRVTSMSFTLATPLEADDMITKALESLNAVIPDGATLVIEVCNNGFDSSPTWQNVTSRVLNGEKIFISNTTKTANKWGYNVRVTVDRKDATGDCYISGMAGFFE